MAIAGHGCSSKDDILKEDSSQTIGNRAHRYRLEKISRDRVFVARLSKIPFAVTTSLP
jgi:hypothetical protein